MIEVDKINEVFVRISCSHSQAMDLKDYISCYIPNRFFHPKVKRKIWDGRISFFDLQQHKLPIGLLPEFDKFCKKNNYEYKFNFKVSSLCERLEKNQLQDFCSKILKNAYTSEGEKIDIRDYQLEGVYKAIRNKRGVLQHSTGAGKSIILYSFVRYILSQNKNRKILLIVPTISLVSQMYSDFKEYGWNDVDKYVTRLCTGYTPDFRKNVLISTWQSVYKKPKSFFNDFNALIVDECHLAKSLSIMTVSKNCENAEFRIGTTGTVPKEETDRYNIFGYLGPIVHKIMYNELIDKGVLSSMKIVNIVLKYPIDVINKNKLKGLRPYPEEKNTVYTYERRNRVFDYIFDKIPDKQNTIILTENIDHLERITEYLQENLDDKYLVENIHGKIKASEREIIRKVMDKEDNMVLIASYGTMSTGVSIKKIHNVILASSYKSEIRVLQTIGRGLRTHKSKDGVIIWDIVDDLTWEKRTGSIGYNHIYKQYLEREKFYKEHSFKSKVVKLNI